jgi:hypothetical protein
MSPKRTLRGVAMTLAIATMSLAAMTATALAAPSAQRQDPVTIQADPPPATNPTIARANQIMGLDYRAFDQLPKNEPPFDWSTNGCSTPWPQGAPIIGDFDDDFRRACDQHDFGSPITAPADWS